MNLKRLATLRKDFRRLERSAQQISKVVHSLGGITVREWPEQCKYWKHPLVRSFYTKITPYEQVVSHGCMFGCKTTKGVALKKPWIFRAIALEQHKAKAFVKSLERRCDGSHLVHGKHGECRGIDCKQSEHYPPLLGRAIHEAFMEFRAYGHSTKRHGERDRTLSCSNLRGLCYAAETRMKSWESARTLQCNGSADEPDQSQLSRIRKYRLPNPPHCEEVVMYCPICKIFCPDPSCREAATKTSCMLRGVASPPRKTQKKKRRKAAPGTPVVMSDNEDESGPNLELLDDRVPEIDRDRGPIRRTAPVRVIRHAVGDDVGADVRDVGLDSEGKVVRATKTKGAGGFMFFMTFSCF